MNRIYKTSVILMFVIMSGCGSKSRIGEGVLHFEEDSTVVLDFRDEPIFQSTIEYSLSLISQDTIRRIKYSDSKVRGQFHPLYKNDSFSSLGLRVVEKANDWYQVVVNEGTSELKWINQTNIELESFEQYFLNIYMIKARNEKLMLFARPDSGSKIISKNLNDTCLESIAFEGQWLRVRNNPKLCGKTVFHEKNLDGFIRWFHNGGINIYYSL